MPASDPGLRRVTVHTGRVDVDLALPAGIPVAALIPEIVDILASCPSGSVGSDPPNEIPPTGWQLSGLGTAPLRASMTLAQNAIHDGAILLLSPVGDELPPPRFHDAAQAVSATLDATVHRWTPQATRLTAAVAANWLTGIGALLLIRNALGRAQRAGSATTFLALASCIALVTAAAAHRGCRDRVWGLALSLMATSLAAVAGFLAVPGVPGAPNVLLAAAAGAVTAALAERATGGNTSTLTAIAGAAAIMASTALVGIMTDAARQALSAVSAVVSLGLLEAAPRMAIRLTGLAPQLADDLPAAKAIRASDWLTSLLAGSAGSAAVSAISTAVPAAGAQTSCSAITFAAIVGLILLLRARTNTEPSKTLILVGSGMATLSAVFAVLATALPQHAGWLAAGTTLLAASAFGLGFIAPKMSWTPVCARMTELAEYLLLAASVPLACWVSGLCRAARDLHQILT